MAVAMILSFFILLIGGMFVTGGIAASASTIAVTVLMLGLGGFALYEMYKLLAADE